MIYLLLILFLFLIANYLTKSTVWYKSIFGDILKFKSIGSNIEIVNLGSNSGKFSFDYSELKIKGENWAMGPQAIEYDKLILEKFISKITVNGTVLIPISLFSSILDYYTDINSYDKYYSLLDSSDIRYYSNRRRLRNWLFLHFPLVYFLFYPKSLIIFLYKLMKGSTTSNKDNFDFNKDAERWVANWKREFKINDLNASLPNRHELIKYKNITRVVEIIEICRKNNLKPILVLSPITHYLQSHITQEVKSVYVDGLCNEVVGITNVTLLDYFYDKDFSKEELYKNAFLLNNKGAKLFTSKVLNDINKLKS